MALNHHKTACILCSENCGIEIGVDEKGVFRSIKGDKENLVSQGYLCQKATRLDYYQNKNERVNTPLKRNEQGKFEAISWDQAIKEIAEKIVGIRDEFGGETLAYYGGGGQGNHLGGVYGASLRAAMGTRYVYTSLAQEKTGDFWVNGKLFGKQTRHVIPDVENAEVVIFLGCNPWHAHGFPRARKVLREIKSDPNRKMIVIDPKRSETAKLSDYFLQVRPGKDAYLLGALLAVLVQDDLLDHQFLNTHCTGYEELKNYFSKVPVDSFCQMAGVLPQMVREVSHLISRAKSFSVRADLGIQQSFNSSLNSYFEKLLFLFTGNFSKKGGHNFHTAIFPLVGHSPEPSESPKVWKTQVTGMKEISKLFPPNILPQEINSDHPKRIRGIVCDSSNPLVSGADTLAFQEAFKKLDLLVVIDVCLTETAELADYVLPASSQFEKVESTFYSLGFPINHLHVRTPFLPPKEGTLPEPEIYRRLVEAMGDMPKDFPILRKVAKLDRKFPCLKLFPISLGITLKRQPKLAGMMGVLLYKTLGNALPLGKEVYAPFWGASHLYAKKFSSGVKRLIPGAKGYGLGEALFNRILHSENAVELSRHEYEENFEFLCYPDKKIHLKIPDLIPFMEELLSSEKEVGPQQNASFPFILSAGERREYNANAIYRNPEWRRKDQEGSLKIHPEDLKKLGFENGQKVLCQSVRSKIEVVLEENDSVRPGFFILPHGHGMKFQGEAKSAKPHGPHINFLTESDYCDPISKTPFHKNVPVNLVALS